jgi:hypothetical protein
MALRRRRPSHPSPTSAEPSSVSDAGSGVGVATLERLIVRLKLQGAATVHAPAAVGALIVYKSVTENGLGSLNDGVGVGPAVLIEVNVWESN